MAVPSYHITDDDSRDYGVANGYTQTGPGTLLMDADAFLIAEDGALLLTGGPWTATINGTVTGPISSATGWYAIQIGTNHSSFPGSAVTFGASADISGYGGAVLGWSPINVTNRGTLTSVSTDGATLFEGGSGDCKIDNSGTLISGGFGITFSIANGDGTHTIINSGSIKAPIAVQNESSVGIEKVTNSGLMDGSVNLGGGNDTFTDFAKVNVKGKIVVHNGTVTGTIDLGDGKDHFTGGAGAEKVQDGEGADSYKLGGGNDTLLAAHDTGSDGVDSIDGAAGRDTFDASAFDGVGTLTINLDTKAHNGIAANSVIFNGQADHVFNFEDVIGSAGSDVIYGSAAANHIVSFPSTGSTGADQLFGFGGNDVLEENHNGGQLFGGDGNDTLLGFGQACVFDGGNGNDIMEAGVGASDMYGGAGADIMTGGDFEGTGGIKHFFRYKALSDSGATAATRDVITNFHPGGTPGVSGDFIDLSLIDAVPSTKNHDDPFHFIGESKWDHQAGALRYVWTADRTIVQADVNGDAKVDFSIALDGHLTLAATDFIL